MMSSFYSNALQFPNPFSSTFNQSPNPKRPSFRRLTPGSAAADDKPPTTPTQSDAGSTDRPAGDSGFEDRLAQIRIKYRSGKGKKAEQRRARKAGGGGGGGKKKGVMLPPVALREAMADGGVKVEAGFTPYSERINGGIAGLGLAALVLVEIGSGKGVLSYHAPPVIFIQIYTIAAAAALFIKFEKERISIWPEKSPSASSSAGASRD
ncbi:hypothetical protein AXF42_Ash008768 [Apostasia shenzhenica]|uniref:Uncharacterized protein n=1 Tax=Apostasia shenzhenica TaxID=1088818 RepID=A0A2I0ASF4_9ASPA|nr:hypothetical protein AXF42_Ash008768 [Apostasia shenzhenica]